MDADQAHLEALGYKEEFKREFGLWSTFAVSFSVLGLLPSIASTLFYGMGYAGTAGMTWGWLLAMIGVQSVAMSMAELCSSMPTSGGLYYAAAVLAPPKWGPLMSWLTGWSNWLCQVTAAPSVNYSTASMILALKTMHDPSYTAATWHVYLLTLGIMVSHGIISSMPTRFIARFNSAGTLMNTICLFVVLFMIIGGAQKGPDGHKFNPTHEVWGYIDNQTDWPNGIAVLMSFISIIWTMSGYDSPFHLAEECSNASVAAPRAIVMTSGVGGLMGWAFQIALAYTVRDVAGVIDDELGQPFVTYLQQCLTPNFVYTITALTIVSGFFMGQACMVAASRVAFAYSRDGCYPLSHIWAQVNPYTQTPVNAVWFNWVIGQLLLLLMFAGDTAIGAIFSVGAISGYIAFTMPIGIKVFWSSDKFKPGPWNLGRWSRPCGILSVCYVALMTPILCFPQYRGENLDLDTMNWTVVVYFGPMLLAFAWFMIDARKWFKGPKVNLEHNIHKDHELEEQSSNGVEFLSGVDPRTNTSGHSYDNEPSKAKDWANSSQVDQV